MHVWRVWRRPVQCREEAHLASLSFEPVNQIFHSTQSVIVLQTRAKMEPPVMKWRMAMNACAPQASKERIAKVHNTLDMLHRVIVYR